MFLNSFEADVKSSWKAFWQNSDPNLKIDADKMNGGLTTDALEKTIKASKWEGFDEA